MIVFFHIEKTAGTTLHRIFVNNCVFYFGLKSWRLKVTDEMILDERKMGLIRKFAPFIRGVGGHNLRPWFNYDNIYPDLRTIVFLREPIKRYISHYRYQRYVMGLDISMEQFLSDSDYDNFITSRLSKEKNLDEAIHQLERITFLGIQEYFDESLLMMRYFLGYPKMCLNYETLNVNSSYVEPVDEIFEDSVVLNRIYEKNLLDLQLYEYALNVLYERQKNDYQGDLKKDVRDFQIQNESYGFSSAKRLINNMLKLFYVRPVEYVLLK